MAKHENTGFRNTAGGRWGGTAAIVLLALGPPADVKGAAMSRTTVERDRFGVTADGTPVDRFTLRNARGMMVRVITFGATVTELWAPDRTGRADDVVLGFDNLAGYEGPQNPYFGGTAGRVAFRITEGKFTLDGQDYRLTLNVPPHHLHGGTKGFSRMVWKGETPAAGKDPAVKLTLESPDGDQGYPGRLEATVVYTLTGQNELAIEYAATTDRPTPVNLTHHSYFNLAGAGQGDVLGHVLQLEAARYTPLDEKKIPTGRIEPVEGTPYDFRRPTAIGARMRPGSEVAGGYDLSYPVDRPDDPTWLVRVATLCEPTSGRVLEVLSTEPAIVLYTGNYLDGTLRGKGEKLYAKHAGVCLETAHLPDSVNRPAFPPVILRPGQAYHHRCVYRFSSQ